MTKGAMGRLIDQEDGHFPLLLAVLPAFVEALPPRHQTSSDFETDEARLEFKNSTILLRNEIKEMQNIITEERIEYELPAKDFSTAFSVVNNTLHCFEDLVSLGTDNVSVGGFGNMPLRHPAQCNSFGYVLKLTTYGRPVTRGPWSS